MMFHFPTGSQIENRAFSAQHQVTSSHRECGNFDFKKLTYICLAILAASIVLWAVGSGADISGLATTGKVLFGLSFPAAIILGCMWKGGECCGALRQKLGKLIPKSDFE